MSRGTLKIIVKSANLSKFQGGTSNMETFAQIVLGEQVRRTKVCEGGGSNPVWNESFTFKKQDENRLGFLVFQGETGNKDDIVGMQEIGINTFIKKKSIIDHKVDLMSNGSVIGEVLINIEFIPEEGQSQLWQSTNQKQKVYGVHKLLITKIKANLDFENTSLSKPPQLDNIVPILKITMGKRIWRSSASTTPGKNLSWSENFNLIIETEKELSLEIIDGDQDIGEERIGSSVIKLKQIKQGTSSNKIPIILDGQSLGFLFFSTEYQVPLASSSMSLDESSLANYGRFSNPPSYRNGKLLISTIRVYLEKNLTVEDAYILIQWGNFIEKSSLKEGQASKLEWKELIAFANQQFENRIAVKLLDKSCNTDDDFIGYGSLIIEESASEGQKFRSQKIELFHEDSLKGQLYIDFEYQLDSLGLKDIAKNDHLDMKRKSKPTKEEIKKREMLQKRKDMMKVSSISLEKNKSFLPQIEDNINTMRLKTPGLKSPQPQPKPAVKAVYSVSLPKIGYDIQIREYNRIYKDSMFGLGMSNIHSAQSLRHSIPSFSMNKAGRFPLKKYDGFDSFGYNAPSFFNPVQEDIYQYSNRQMYSLGNRYKIFHRSPTQKPGVSFGVGKRFEVNKSSSPGYYLGPQIVNYNE